MNTKKKLVLIITDSLGLPRDTPEVVRLHKTYIYRLKDDEDLKNYEFIQLSIGGATVNTLYDQAMRYYSSLNPDIVVIQSGIVDCAPRAFTRIELKIMNLTIITSKITNKILKPYSKKIRSKRNITYTPINNFKIISEKFRATFYKSKVYWIGIITASEAYENFVPGIKKNIETYNCILKSIYQQSFIDLKTIPDDGVSSDYHHLSEQGHDFLFHQLKSKIFVS